SNPPPTPSNPPPTPWSIPELLRVLRVLSQCQEEMRWQDAQRTVLELHALRLTQPFVELGDVIQRVEQLEARINRSQPHEVGEPLPPTAVSPEPPSPPPLSLDRLGAPNPEGSPATGDWLGWVRERWDKIRHELWKRPGVASVFDAARLEAASESELSILFREAFHVEQAKRNLSFIEDTVAQVTGRRFRVQCQQGDVPEPQETFVVVPEEDSLQETMVKADEGVRKVLRHFPGTIRPKSSASETTP
ncbi:MAG: hypothetical protein HYZ73_03450, partial [Elusimicrobia bacterium]|nr:hypothetical protein [Elusimicrobiota bacterium]